jgi:plastocyanin
MKTAAQLESSGFNSRTLLHLAVAGNLVILLYMTIALGDILALALALLLLVGLGLLRFRSGALGILLIGLVSTDIAVWTVSGAISNFISGEKLTALILPGYLGTISLIGVTAATATWITRKEPEKGSRAAKLTGQVVLALLLVITASGLLVRQRQVEVKQVTDINLTAENMHFSQTELSSENGQVTLHLSNHDLWWHTFTIDELGVDVKIPMEAERVITFSALPGTYRYYCSIPGHEATMHGTLVIK